MQHSLCHITHLLLQVSGKITYCGHEFSEFYPERTSAYVSQYDLHNGEMTVRETMDFSRRCLGIGARYDMLSELARRERNAGIKPDPEIDAFMKATAVEGKETNVMTDITLKVCSRNILQVKIKWFRPSGFKLAICFSYYSYEESLVKIFSLSLAHFLITGGRHTM